MPACIIARSGIRAHAGSAPWWEGEGSGDGGRACARPEVPTAGLPQPSGERVISCRPQPQLHPLSPSECGCSAPRKAVSAGEPRSCVCGSGYRLAAFLCLLIFHAG